MREVWFYFYNGSMITISPYYNTFEEAWKARESEVGIIPITPIMKGYVRW